MKDKLMYLAEGMLFLTAAADETCEDGICRDSEEKNLDESILDELGKIINNI